MLGCYTSFLLSGFIIPDWKFYDRKKLIQASLVGDLKVPLAFQVSRTISKLYICHQGPYLSYFTYGHHIVIKPNVPYNQGISYQDQSFSIKISIEIIHQVGIFLLILQIRGRLSSGLLPGRL